MSNLSLFLDTHSRWSYSELDDTDGQYFYRDFYRDNGAGRWADLVPALYTGIMAADWIVNNPALNTLASVPNGAINNAVDLSLLNGPSPRLEFDPGTFSAGVLRNPYSFIDAGRTANGGTGNFISYGIKIASSFNPIGDQVGLFAGPGPVSSKGFWTYLATENALIPGAMQIQYATLQTSTTFSNIKTVFPFYNFANIADDLWHHVIIVRDNIIFVWRLYVDGALVSTTQPDGSEWFEWFNYNLGSTFWYFGYASKFRYKNPYPVDSIATGTTSLSDADAFALFTAWSQDRTGNTIPNVPTNLKQRDSALIIVPPAGTITDGTVNIQSDVSDPDGNPLKLQAEIRENSQSFLNTSTHESGIVASGTLAATVTASALTSGKAYKWQVRTQDAAGAKSTWVANGGNPDFSTQGKPTWTTIGNFDGGTNPKAHENIQVIKTILVKNPDGGATDLALSIQSSSGMSSIVIQNIIDLGSGILQANLVFTPFETASNAGPYVIVLRATNTITSLFSDETFSVTVINDAPILDTINQTIFVAKPSETFAQIADADGSDQNGHTLTYFIDATGVTKDLVSKPIPTWISINSTSGIISVVGAGPAAIDLGSWIFPIFAKDGA